MALGKKLVCRVPNRKNSATAEALGKHGVSGCATTCDGCKEMWRKFPAMDLQSSVF